MFFRIYIFLLNPCLMFIATIVVMYVLHARSWTQGPRTETVPVPFINYSLETMKEHEIIIKNFYEERKDWVTSNLGTYLFKHDIQTNNTVLNQSLHRIYDVLIWMHWPWLKIRHLALFTEYGNNPIYGCSVSNCRFSEGTNMSSADAVLIHLQVGIIPQVERRNPRQLWIFWIDESPTYTFRDVTVPPSYEAMSNIFNWSMTYRTDSDVPIPYGRTLPLLYPKTPNLRLGDGDQNSTIKMLNELVPFWKDKQMNVLATILISNCVADRMRFLLNLKKHMKIDIYGECADEASQRTRCPGHENNDCEIFSKYLFYLVIENSYCRQYISEKSFHHAYDKGAIPVIVGAFLEDCRKLLPPNSFLHIDHFKTLKNLALELTDISKNVSRLLFYHIWRNHFKVVNEHGYFKTPSRHLCRVCEALNYNQRSRKVYGISEMRRFLDPEIQCS